MLETSRSSLCSSARSTPSCVSPISPSNWARASSMTRAVALSIRLRLTAWRRVPKALFSPSTNWFTQSEISFDIEP